MNANILRKPSSLGAGRAVGACLLAYVALIVSQLAALLAGQGLVNAGLPAAAGSAISGVLYVALALLCAHFISSKLMKTSLASCRAPGKPSVKAVWAAAAVLLPVFVIFLAARTPGSWSVTAMSPEMLSYTIVDAVVYYGLAAGIVEEVVFRGIIMTALERRWNKAVAVVVPSVIFALSHVIGAELDFLSFLQLLAAGSLVGVLFSFVTYASGSVWNSALMHCVWNILMVGGICCIGTEKNDLFLFNYVLESRDFLITGGDFGIEASVFSIIGYALFLALALAVYRRRVRRAQ